MMQSYKHIQAQTQQKGLLDKASDAYYAWLGRIERVEVLPCLTTFGVIGAALAVASLATIYA